MTEESAPATARPKHRGFHVHDGWFFERLPDNGVRIYVLERNHVDAPVLRQVDVDGHAWASVVSGMSAGGETGDTYRAAADFHFGAARVYVLHLGTQHSYAEDGEDGYERCKRCGVLAEGAAALLAYGTCASRPYATIYARSIGELFTRLAANGVARTLLGWTLDAAAGQQVLALVQALHANACKGGWEPGEHAIGDFGAVHATLDVVAL